MPGLSITALLAFMTSSAIMMNYSKIYAESLGNSQRADGENGSVVNLAC
jgi:hypothetical protein